MQKSFLMAFLALITVWGFQNCGRRGTETGNPKTTTAYKILRSMCERMSQCNGRGGDVDYCADQLFDEPGLPQSLGVDPAAGISTMKELAWAEIAGRIIPQGSAARTCEAEIASVSCGSPAMSEIVSSPVSAAPVSQVGGDSSLPSSLPMVVLPHAAAVATAEEVFGSSVSCQSSY